jgi:hypothetical protein
MSSQSIVETQASMDVDEEGEFVYITLSTLVSYSQPPSSSLMSPPPNQLARPSNIAAAIVDPLNFMSLETSLDPKFFGSCRTLCPIFRVPLYVSVYLRVISIYYDVCKSVLIRESRSTSDKDETQSATTFSSASDDQTEKPQTPDFN